MKIQIQDLTFSQYFKILQILNADQYDYTKHPSTGKLTKNKTPLKKQDRTEEFLFELHREVVKQMCDLGKDFINDDTFISICWDLVAEKLEEINVLVAHEGYDDINETFNFKGKNIGFVGFKKWSFNKWVNLENGMKGTSQKIGNETVIVEHGAKFLLPICFGDWNDEMPDFNEKYKYFNNELLAKDVALTFAKINNMINALKNAHYPMYSETESGGGNSKNYKMHVDFFGWQETLRALAKERVFGDYLQLKSAPLLEVLEYLNCSVSAELAREKDFNIANKKRQD